MLVRKDPRATRQVDQIVAKLVEEALPGDHIVIMSNGGFGGIHQKLLQALRQRVDS